MEGLGSQVQLHTVFKGTQVCYFSSRHFAEDRQCGLAENAHP